jgi:hypothetical protein
MNIEAIANEILEGLDKSKAAKPANTFKLPGKGRKLCPQCKVYVGARTQQCECGYEFIIGSAPASTVAKNEAWDEPLTDEDKRYIRAIGAGRGGRVVHVGAGAPPADLKMCDEQSVRDFCEDIVAAGLKDNKLYMPRAIKNFMRHVIGERAITNQYTDVYIDKWYSDKVASTMEVISDESL